MKGFSDVQATIEIDLTRTEEELWNSIDKDARWGVKKAEKEGLLISGITQESDWKEFYEIYKKTIIAGGIVPDDFDEIKLKDYMLFVCRKNDKIIAGAIIFIEKDKFTLKYNASLHEFLNLQPNNLLYWHLIKWGKERGFKVFDLGGYQINASGHLTGVNRFKERWGGKVIKYKIHSWNPIYILGRKVIRNCPKIKAFREKIKMKKYL
jgi:lipid II:glycine glycyltransferase (peptidoglycan interpeptide bridge formation enzyme)